MFRLVVPIRLIKIIVFFWCITCCTIPNIYGQLAKDSNSYIDSLKKKLIQVTDSAKVDLLNTIAYNYYYLNNDSTDDYAIMAYDLASSLNYKKGLSEAQRLLGIALKAKNQEKEAISWLYSGLETAESINYSQGIADNLNSIGIFYHSIEDYNGAISYFMRSVHYQKMAKNRLREGILYSNIGSLYLLKNELDSSYYYFRNSEHILDSIGDEKWIAMVKSQFGGLWIKLGSLDRAEEYSQRALDISLRIGQKFHVRKSYQNFAEIHLKRQDYALANNMADKALEICNEISFVPYLIEAYKVKYQIAEQQNQISSAFSYYQKYAAYKDTLRMNQLRSESNVYKYKIELEQKENENLLLRNEKELQDALIQRQTFVSLSVSIILILVSILAVILFRLRKRDQEINARISESNKKLEDQQEKASATLRIVEQLNAQLQAQKNTLDQSAIVSTTDLNGKITSVNDNFCDVSGYSRDELLGSSHRIVDSGEHGQEVFAELWETITQGNTWRYEFKNKKKNGEYFWVDTAISPIFDDSGKPKEFFSLQFDVTERKNYLDQLQAKSKELEDLNDLKNKLLSIVSHDFRSPLNSLKGTLSLYIKGALKEEELNMLTVNLLDKLDNTYTLLENLLSWAKSQMQGMKVYPKHIDLNTISNDCIELLSPIADKKLVKIKNQIKSPVIAYADNEMVKLVVRNLMSNAIKYTTTGNEIILDAIAERDKITISVADNGTGISNEIQDKLFKLESISTKGTADETGMGLGLLLCKDFVDKNGGTIWFESELEKGTTFYFTLPVKPTR